MPVIPLIVPRPEDLIHIIKGTTVFVRLAASDNFVALAQHINPSSLGEIDDIAGGDNRDLRVLVCDLFD